MYYISVFSPTQDHESISSVKLLKAQYAAVYLFQRFGSLVGFLLLHAKIFLIALSKLSTNALGEVGALILHLHESPLKCADPHLCAEPDESTASCP